MSGRLLEALEQFLKKDDWKYFLKDDRTVSTAIQAKNGTFNGVFRAEGDDRRILFYFFCPYNIPANKRAAVGEFINRVNFGMPLTCLETDLDTGEVRCKSVLLGDEGRANSSDIESMIYANFLTLDKYFPGINAIVYGASSPAEAARGCED